MLTVLFIITLVLISTLVGVKMYELSKGKQTVLTSTLRQYDGKTDEMLHVIQVRFESEKHRAYVSITEDLPRQLYSTVLHGKETLQKQYQSLFPNIRGVKVLRADRDASIFLQNLSVERQRDGKGRIEDEGIVDSR